MWLLRCQIQQLGQPRKNQRYHSLQFWSWFVRRRRPAPPGSPCRSVRLWFLDLFPPVLFHCCSSDAPDSADQVAHLAQLQLPARRRTFTASITSFSCFRKTALLTIIL